MQPSSRKVLIFLFLVLALFGVFTPKPPQQTDKFLKARGAELFLGGRAFRTVGFNKYDLFLQYLGLEGGPNAKHSAKAVIKELGRHNFKVIRLMISPFYPAHFNAVFFDDDPQEQSKKKEKFLAALREMLDDCDAADIKIVASLMWNIENLADLGYHSIHEGLTSPQSPGYRKFEDFLSAIVNECKNSPVVAIWEVGNEYNLAADVQMAEGIFEGKPEGDILHPGPVVRDFRNNFNSAEMTAFFKRVFLKIKSIDQNHLVTTGTSEPRPYAWHLYRAALSGKGADWTKDNPEESGKYIRMTHQDADVISIHWYLDNVDLGWYQNLARQMAKPILISEIGPNFQGADEEIVAARADYTFSFVIDDIGKKLRQVVENKMPASLFWTYSENPGLFQICYGKTDEALRLIEQANKNLKRR